MNPWGKLSADRSQSWLTSMISDEAFDRMREAWAALVPEPYRYRPTGETYWQDGRAAIILPPPPEAVLEHFLATLTPHLRCGQKVLSKGGLKPWQPGKKKTASRVRPHMVMAA